MVMIIGIDPGSRMTGYGIVEQTSKGLVYLDSGTIRTESKEIPERLKRIFEGLSNIVQHYQKYRPVPFFAAIEQVFMAQNPDSALKLGQARGAAIAALMAQNLSVNEYTARQIKQSVCGYGAASKEQVSAMVCQILRLDFIPQADAADGLACAICHAHTRYSLDRLTTNHTANPLNSLNQTRHKSGKKGRWRLTEEDLAKFK